MSTFFIWSNIAWIHSFNPYCDDNWLLVSSNDSVMCDCIWMSYYITGLFTFEWSWDLQLTKVSIVWTLMLTTTLKLFKSLSKEKLFKLHFTDSTITIITLCNELITVWLVWLTDWPTDRTVTCESLLGSLSRRTSVWPGGGSDGNGVYRFGLSYLKTPHFLVYLNLLFYFYPPTSVAMGMRNAVSMEKAAHPP